MVVYCVTRKIKPAVKNDGTKLRRSVPDPFQQVGGESLVLFHEPLVVLVDLQHLADPVGRHLSLEKRGKKG